MSKFEDLKALTTKRKAERKQYVEDLHTLLPTGTVIRAKNCFFSREPVVCRIATVHGPGDRLSVQYLSDEDRVPGYYTVIRPNQITEVEE
jgi:hypothetical protein